MLKSKRRRRWLAIDDRARLYVAEALLGGVPTDKSRRVKARARRIGPKDIDRIILKNSWLLTFPGVVGWSDKLRKSLAAFSAHTFGAARAVQGFGSNLADIVFKMRPVSAPILAPTEFIEMKFVIDEPIKGQSFDMVIIDDPMKDPPNGENLDP